MRHLERLFCPPSKPQTDNQPAQQGPGKVSASASCLGERFSCSGDGTHRWVPGTRVLGLANRGFIFTSGRVCITAITFKKRPKHMQLEAQQPQRDHKLLRNDTKQSQTHKTTQSVFILNCPQVYWTGLNFPKVCFTDQMFLYCDLCPLSCRPG